MRTFIKIILAVVIFGVIIAIAYSYNDYSQRLDEDNGPSNFHKPASFTISSLVVSPREIELEDSVEITVFVRNEGDLEGYYAAELEINEVVKATKNIGLTGGASESVVFSYEPEEHGKHSVKVEGLSSDFNVILRVDSQVLYQEYDANEIAADAKYEDQIIFVEGEIRSIGRNIVDDAYVVLVGDGLFGGVQCLFEEENEEQLIELAEGQTVTVKGRCDGYLLNVILRDCTIVS